MDLVKIEAKQEIDNITKALTDLGFEVAIEDESMPVFDQLMFLLSVLHRILDQIIRNS